MSMIGAVSTSQPVTPAQAVLVQPKQDKDRDEATESNATKVAEAASPHALDIKA